MARGINKVIIVGNLGKAPEVRYAQNGNAVANFSLATSEEWNDKNTGQKVVKTEWHNVVVFGKLAQIAGQYLQKGSQVYIEGKLTTEKWTDREGKERWTTKIVVDQRGTMQMLGSRQDAAQQQAAPQPQQPARQVANGAPVQQQAAPAQPQQQPAQVAQAQQQPAPANFASPPPAPQAMDFDDSSVPF